MSFNIPVLFLIFRRKEVTQRAFTAIRDVKPLQLFIAGDGGRTHEEHERCVETRQAVLDMIDWECEVKTLFRDKNLGCRNAVSSAITWFFEQVEEGIILEEDCLAEPSFFAYCAELLERYRFDIRIMSVSGTNFQNGIRRGKADYYFSTRADCWGWATWRRAWSLYDRDMRHYPEFKENNLLATVLPHEHMRRYWEGMLESVYAGETSSWATIWVYSIWINHGLCIKPNVNLVSNIGFDSESTHCANPESPLANAATSELVVTKHPAIFIPDLAAELEEHKDTRISPLKYMLRHPLFLFRRRFWQEFIFKT